MTTDPTTGTLGYTIHRPLPQDGHRPLRIANALRHDLEQMTARAAREGHTIQWDTLTITPRTVTHPRGPGGTPVQVPVLSTTITVTTPEERTP